MGVQHQQRHHAQVCDYQRYNLHSQRSFRIADGIYVGDYGQQARDSQSCGVVLEVQLLGEAQADEFVRLGEQIRRYISEAIG